MEKITRMTDVSGDTALHKAVRSQHLDVVKLLVKEDSEFEFLPNHVQEKPLYLAAESGFHDALINILESYKKPAYAVGPSNRTPLHAAVIHEHKGLEDIVSDMLWWKKSLVYLLVGSENDWTIAIHIAASKGDLNIINELLNHCPDCRDLLNSNNQNALHIALLNNLDENMALKRKNHLAPQPEDPLGEHVSYVDFTTAFTTLAQSVAAQNKWPPVIPANPVANSTAASI
ncbi:hypothetical protein T459_15414 [Capsicum annuum]|uniref:Uncharacterized protein n=1 Tax=Capsicum annuum TaxID=4072 RepID=A0A2G2ZK97_CAPAN|nr:hypothetical protein T459_15414 [Capsicum annuum]